MRFLFASLFAFALVGCATTPKGPTAGPDPAKFVDQQLQVPEQGVTDFKVRWEGTLQSPEDAKAQRAQWELVVDGKVVKSGEESLNLELPAGQTVPVALEQAGRYVGNEEELKAFDARAGSLLVALRGKLFVERQGTQDVLEFARSREIRLPRLPVPGLRDVEGSRYSAENVNLTFFLTINNPNPFPIKVDKLSYVAEVGGKKMTEGEVGTGNTVNASETDVYEFTVTLDPATYGPEVKKLIASQSIPYKVTGKLEGDMISRPFDAEGVVRVRSSE